MTSKWIIKQIVNETAEQLSGDGRQKTKEAKDKREKFLL